MGAVHFFTWRKFISFTILSSARNPKHTLTYILIPHTSWPTSSSLFIRFWALSNQLLLNSYIFVVTPTWIDLSSKKEDNKIYICMWSTSSDDEKLINRWGLEIDMINKLTMGSGQKGHVFQRVPTCAWLFVPLRGKVQTSYNLLRAGTATLKDQKDGRQPEESVLSASVSSESGPLKWQIGRPSSLYPAKRIFGEVIFHISDEPRPLIPSGSFSNLFDSGSGFCLVTTIYSTPWMIGEWKAQTYFLSNFTSPEPKQLRIAASFRLIYTPFLLPTLSL